MHCNLQVIDPFLPPPDPLAVLFTEAISPTSFEDKAHQAKYLNKLGFSLSLSK
jgi:hypothetical protein